MSDNKPDVYLLEFLSKWLIAVRDFPRSLKCKGNYGANIDSRIAIFNERRILHSREKRETCWSVSHASVTSRLSESLEVTDGDRR